MEPAKFTLEDINKASLDNKDLAEIGALAAKNNIDRIPNDKEINLAPTTTSKESLNIIADEARKTADEYATEAIRGEILKMSSSNKSSVDAVEPKKEDPTEDPKALERALQEKLVNKTLELIKHDPRINFVSYGIGNVTDEERGSGTGASGGIFDQQKQKMVSTRSLEFLDDRPSGDKELFTGYTKFSRSDPWIYALVQFRVRCFEGDPMEPRNNYMTDNRGNSYISIGVRFQESLDSEIVKKLTEGFRHPNNDEADKFLGEVAVRAAHQFIPGYWDFILRQSKIYKESIGKK